MSRAPIPMEQLYWLADATGLHLEQGRNGISAKGVVRIPLTEGLSLACAMKVVDSMYRKQSDVAALLIHVRWDLHLLIIRFGGDSGAMIAIDASNARPKMSELFKSAMNINTVISRLTDTMGAIAGVWYVDDNNDKWREIDAADLDESVFC